MCFSPGKVLVPGPEAMALIKPGLGSVPVTSPLGFSFCIWTCRVGAKSLPRLFPVLTLWGALLLLLRACDLQALWMASEGWAEAAVESGREGRGGTQRPGGRVPCSWLRKLHGWNTCAIQCAVFFESSLACGGSSVSTHQIRVDFWERLVVSGGRVARVLMQEAAFKVWSLEQGNLMPEPWPTPSPPTSALPAFLLSWATPSAHLRPCHSWQLCPSGNSDTGVPEGLLAFSICLPCGFASAWASKSLSSGSFLRRKLAADAIAYVSTSSHRAAFPPSRSAACGAGPQKDQCMWCSHGSDEVSRDEVLQWCLSLLLPNTSCNS